MTSPLRGLHLHFQPLSGIAGDMTVGALVDLGVPTGVVKGAVDALGVPGLSVGFEERRRGAFRGRGFVVREPGNRRRKHEADHHDHDHDREHDRDRVHHHDHEHRDYRAIKKLIARAALPVETRRIASDIFARLAAVEGQLHGVAPDYVTFHEVGAYDSIADVVGAAAALAWLAPASVGSTPPVVGSGAVTSAHGLVPVPAPATAALLAGVPILSEGQGELTTPTGAAILTCVVGRYGPPPPMRLRAVGHGAGTRRLEDRPNILRVLAGEPIGLQQDSPADEVAVLDANIDDMSPELVAPLFDALFAAGALDVWSVPILMKKGRPAIQVSAMVAPASQPPVEAAFFRHSTTLGLRVRTLARVVLARSLVDVSTEFGRARVKLAALDGEVVTAAPELESCRRLATDAGVPLRHVIAAAAAAAQSLVSVGPKLPAGRGRRARGADPTPAGRSR